MNEIQNCPKCNSEYAYFDGNLYVCPECGHEWSADQEENGKIVKDINGAILNDGDSVVVIKDLNIKGTSSTIKRGTKVKIRLVEDDGVGHDIECKFSGVGTIKLKSSLVKKN